ncbi:DoxX family protein [Photobacterium sanctipauli]|uniref:DoxX family protein n=1 Tax=Photobacterium sanctipauli TaxID=1342794 RepID=A0A2T3NEW2_9GAMM|nr:DoxX family protein [Photobacterium sanctipauli]PSW13082.1 DoxX family protein [Photobacterium sanctipauli]
MLNFFKQIDPTAQKITDPLIPLLLLFTRLWVAWAFFKSGMVKYSSWDSTLYLFEYEYQVPLLPWQLAAYMGTAAELILPVFLALGLFTRPMALVLFVFNIIAVVSYPLLWERGFFDHQLWGMMMLVNVFWGAGMISLDRLISSEPKQSLLE